MPCFIVFTLAGPLASFGSVAGNVRRGTESRPGHAMLVGLVAAALGIRRDQSGELAALSDACKFAVRVDQPGELMTDFHTAQSAKRTRGFAPKTRRQMLVEGERTTIVTRREYLCDVRFTIAADIDHPRLSQSDVIACLKQPRFTLYLGRKSCPPALPLDPLSVEAATVDGAFGHYDTEAGKRLAALTLRDEATKDIAVDARLDVSAPPARRERRRVLPVDRGTWRFDPLEELVLTATPSDGPPADAPDDEER